LFHHLGHPETSRKSEFHIADWKKLSGFMYPPVLYPSASSVLAARPISVEQCCPCFLHSSPFFFHFRRPSVLFFRLLFLSHLWGANSLCFFVSCFSQPYWQRRVHVLFVDMVGARSVNVMNVMNTTTICTAEFLTGS